jgi:hypothetical protein
VAKGAFAPVKVLDVHGWHALGVVRGGRRRRDGCARGWLAVWAGRDRLRLDDTAIEPPSDSQYSNDTAYKASFIHRATDENSRGDYTYIGDPSINGSPNAIVLISHQRNIGSASYNHNIGVWYEAGA